ncbi:iron ABC transporter permease [Streptomyces sp. NPDC005438]|uniref:FecCD family ABC transporter permease n=1 Tax=Streptomyces sp. NPDC005438 TaxID=3156880 RepID=UPI0033A887DE
MTARRGVRLGPVGLRLTHRALYATVAVLALLLLGCWIALFTGDLDLSTSRVWATLGGDGTTVERLVVVDRRLARTLAALLIGFALGCAGALTQSITRNPIASPDILGVTSGASFFAVVLVTRPEITSSVADRAPAELVAPAALLGGLLTTACILALSWRGGFDGLRLILVGLSVNSLTLAGVAWLLTRAEMAEAQAATRWLSGSLNGARMPEVLMMAPVMAGGLLLCLMLARDLAALRMGRDLAPALGTAPARTEGLALLVAVVLVSVATAVAGPVSFVAFIAPQAAMRAFGTAGPPPVAGGLIGALLVLGADLVGSRLPAELPVGVPTAVIGAPFLLYLLIQHRRRTSV